MQMLCYYTCICMGVGGWRGGGAKRGKSGTTASVPGRHKLGQGLPLHTCCLTGLIAGCPTTVVPFFGDQPFWGAACARMGVGPKPIPIDKLDTPSLVEALKFMMKPEVQAAAQERGQGIKHVCIPLYMHLASYCGHAMSS